MQTVATGGEVSFQLDPVRHLVRCTLDGPVSPEQMIGTIKKIHADPIFGPNFDAIIDFRNFSGRWTRNDLREIAGTARENAARPGVRRAMLVSQEWQYDLIKTLQAATLLSPVIYRPFQSPEAAEDWLSERRP